MSAVAWCTGEAEWTVRPSCVDIYVSELCIFINDYLDSGEARERLIRPRMFDVVGTVSTDESVLLARRRRATIFACSASQLVGKLSAVPEVVRAVRAARSWVGDVATSLDSLFRSAQLARLAAWDAWEEGLEAADAAVFACSCAAAGLRTSAKGAALAGAAAWSAAQLSNSHGLADDVIQLAIECVFDLCGIGERNPVKLVRQLSELPAYRP